LIAAGHTWQAIQGYTLPQLELFIAGADRVQRDKMRSAMIACRATNADGKAFKAIMKELD